MKWLKEENDKLIPPPTYDEETGMVNCHVNVEWLINHGYKEWSDQSISNWYENHNPIEEKTEPQVEPSKEDFNKSCLYFKQICHQIGALINDPNFKGGYDDMIEFYDHPAYKTSQGVQLAIAWSGSNDLCRYEANKIGLGSPEWWYKCWEDEK